jgi:hypothetical protein
MTHHIHTTNTPIFIIPCKQSAIIRMSKTHKYNLTRHHHTWLFKYFHETSKARLISSQSFKLSWFESIGLVGNGFVKNKKFLMELQTWVDFMELWTYLICSWVGFATCSFTMILRKKTCLPICKDIDKIKHGYQFTKILRKEDMRTNLQRSWENKTWVPICKELKK